MKCPFCSEQIEDGSRFCLYCMSPLTPKETAKAPRGSDAKIIAAVVAGTLLVSACAAALPHLVRKGGVSTPAEKTEMAAPQTPVRSPVPAESAAPLPDADKKEGDDAPAVYVPPVEPVDDPVSHDDPGFYSDETDDEKETGTANTPSGAGTQSGTQIGTQTGTQSGTQTGTQSGTQTGTQTETQTETQTDAENAPWGVAGHAEYTYRQATQSDDFWVFYPFEEDDIVITGVSVPSENGVYVIPEYIDGKCVREIMSFAFTAPDIAGGVRTVVIPSTVRTIWDAFLDCVNLKHVYVKRKSIYITNEAFHCYHRTDAPLIFHCPADCDNMAFTYYKNVYTSPDDILWEEWNW